jgi:SAM-dependent methyltransferase
MKSNLHKYIFTEDLDYLRTPVQSIWGAGDSDTLQVLKRLLSEKKLSGSWLHFAAGDGRYNNILLQNADTVFATDIDPDALEKLRRVTPIELSAKLSTQVQNITEQFPFPVNAFDGVFNTGTLHLFPADVLDTVFAETRRVLKPNGLFIFDFAADIKRIRQDGTILQRSDTVYTKQTAGEVLSRLLGKHEFKSQYIDCSVPPEKVTSGAGTYTFSCGYRLVIAKKQ